MATEVLKSFGTLQLELEQAKTSLKGVDENIKRLIGRDPSENPIGQRSGLKRAINNRNNTTNSNNNNKLNYEHDDVLHATKKRSVDSSVFKRLSDRSSTRYFSETGSGNLDGALTSNVNKGNQLISKVIVTPKEVPSRQQVLAAQGADEKSKARNRRMFGALLGTLQKFRQEETKLKSKEDKRAQVEKKLEEQQVREREELKKERQDLFFNRKRKQAEIRMIELKMSRMKDHAAWEEKHKPLVNFIQTKTKPHICYLPRVLNETDQKLLAECKQKVEKMIEDKRQEISEELNAIEQKMKKNYTRQQSSDSIKHGDDDGNENVEEEQEQEEEDINVKKGQHTEEEQEEEEPNVKKEQLVNVVEEQHEDQKASFKLESLSDQVMNSDNGAKTTENPTEIDTLETVPESSSTTVLSEILPPPPTSDGHVAAVTPEVVE